MAAGAAGKSVLRQYDPDARPEPVSPLRAFQTDRW